MFSHQAGKILTKKSGGAPPQVGVTTFFSKMVGSLLVGVTILGWQGLAAESAGAKTYTFTDNSGRAKGLRNTISFKGKIRR
jgi:hypothetical protein